MVVLLRASSDPCGILFENYRRLQLIRHKISKYTFRELVAPGEVLDQQERMLRAVEATSRARWYKSGIAHRL